VSSTNLVPLTVYKGAGHEHIPFAAGSPHITADFHSIRTKTDNAPTYITSGFYKVEAGPKLSAHYAFEEAKVCFHLQNLDIFYPDWFEYSMSSPAKSTST
jgi:hypothetical protein